MAESQRHPSGEIARQPLFGFDNETDALDVWLRIALSGYPIVIAIRGDPGAGKSTLAAWLTTRAEARGARVLSGRATGGVAIPFLPIRSALEPVGRVIGDASGPDPFEPALEGVAELTAESGDLVEQQRIGLLLDLSETIVALAREQPLVLLVEDLQWADEASVELIDHLVANARAHAQSGSLPLLVIVTARTSAGRPSAAVLERIAREPIARELRLGGMDEATTNLLITHVAGLRPSRALLAAIVDATRGNPGLIRALLAELLGSSAAVDVAGELTLAHDGDLPLVMPGDVDTEVRARLAGLSPPAREHLCIAALLGDRRPLEEVRFVADAVTVSLPSPGMSFSQAMEEARARGIISTDDGHLEFLDHHAGYVLASDVDPSRRAAVHGRIADTLEALYGDHARHTLVIAHHLERAPNVDPARLARVAAAAGEHAAAAGAWAAAAAHFETAIDARRRSDKGNVPADDPVVARLLLRCGTARFRHHDPVRAAEALEEAVRGLRAAGDIAAWGEALLTLMRIRLSLMPQDRGGRVDPAPLEEFVAESAGAEPVLRARALHQMADIAMVNQQFEQGKRYAAEARALAAEAGDPHLLAQVEVSAGLQSLGLLELDAAEADFAASRMRATGDPWVYAWGATRVPLVKWMSGRLRGAYDDAADAARVLGANQDWSEHSLAATCVAGIALARGAFADAERAGAEAERLYLRSNYTFTPALLYPTLACARAYRGDRRGAHEALDRWSATGRGGHSGFRPLVDALAGVPSAGDSIPRGPLGRPNFFTVRFGAMRVELGDLLDDAELLATGAPAVRTALAAGVRFVPGWCFFLPRLAAIAAWKLGRLDEASVAFDDAMSIAQRAGSATELARTAADTARFLTATGGDEARAAMLLERARGELDTLGMLAFIHAPHAAPRPATALPTRVIMCSDLVDSTGLNRRLGDRNYRALLHRHNAIIRARLRESDGVEFKHTGDGICAWFSSAPRAVRCAIDVQRDLHEYNRGHADEALYVRIGLSLGRPMVDVEGLLGLTVVAAARLCATAQRGEILLSEDVAGLLPPSVPVRLAGTRDLKGYPEPCRVYRALIDGDERLTTSPGSGL